MAIYSSKCKECKEASKKEIKQYDSTPRGVKKYVGSMYECENENCEINITRKKKLKGYNEYSVDVRNYRNNYKSANQNRKRHQR